VDELKPEDVSIVDADSDRSLGLGHEGAEQGEATEASLTQRLIGTLEPIVGQDKIRASVNVDYDQGSTEETQEKYDPAVSAVLSEQKTDQRSGGPAGVAGGAVAASGGIPGTASNIPSKQAQPQTSVAQSVQTSTSESAQYGVNKTETHTLMPAGRIQRVTAAIVVDDAVERTVVNGKETFKRTKRTPEELDKIQQLAAGVIGFDAKRGDTISVQNLSFDSPLPGTDFVAPNWEQKAQKAVTDYSSLLRPVSLLLLFVLAYMFVLRPIQRQALGPGQSYQAPQQALENAPAGRLAIGGGVNDTRGANQLKEQTIEMIRQKPVNTARAVQAWLREEPS